MSKQLVLKIDKNGRITSEWWTKESADMICRLCQKCKGWNSGEKPLECVAGNQWCG